MEKVRFAPASRRMKAAKHCLDSPLDQKHPRVFRTANPLGKLKNQPRFQSGNPKDGAANRRKPRGLPAFGLQHHGARLTPAPHR